MTVQKMSELRKIDDQELTGAISLASQPMADDEPDEAADPSKPPPGYSYLLRAAREAAAITQRQLGEMTGLGEKTIRRNEEGGKYRAVKSMRVMRDALIGLGQKLPPIPIGEIPAASEPQPSKLSPMGDRIRWNLIRFREALDLDRAGAAYVAKIPLRMWIRFEDGDDEPSGSQLMQIAQGFGCTLGAFDLDEKSPLPTLKLTPDNDRYARFNRLVADATPDELAQLEKLEAAMRARAKGAAEADKQAKKPKR
jgi:transcriptional regulator with XRE-family HTH domain